ncbi:hypothetical protein JCM9533A_82410 [Catenuloplanes niger JCM 9533]
MAVQQGDQVGTFRCDLHKSSVGRIAAYFCPIHARVPPDGRELSGIRVRSALTSHPARRFRSMDDVTTAAGAEVHRLGTVSPGRTVLAVAHTVATPRSVVDAVDSGE